MRPARHILLGAWGGYALLWLAFLAILYWPRPRQEEALGEAMIVILGFSAGLIVTLALLLIGVVLGWRALRLTLAAGRFIRCTSTRVRLGWQRVFGLGSIANYYGNSRRQMAPPNRLLERAGIQGCGRTPSLSAGRSAPGR